MLEANIKGSYIPEKLLGCYWQCYYVLECEKEKNNNNLFMLLGFKSGVFFFFFDMSIEYGNVRFELVTSASWGVVLSWLSYPSRVVPVLPYSLFTHKKKNKKKKKNPAYGG
jgi:hypothetical protein